MLERERSGGSPPAFKGARKPGERTCLGSGLSPSDWDHGYWLYLIQQLFRDPWLHPFPQQEQREEVCGEMPCG